MELFSSQRYAFKTSKKMKIDLFHTIDWNSFKMNTVSVVLAAITMQKILILATILSVASTFIYNGIKIYKELKNKKKNGSE